MAKITKEAALLYHSQGKPGKIEVVPTKPYSTQTDLSLAYSPGVAEPCLEIEKNPQDAYKYTAKGNLVAVISNGTAVLGLGDIGALSGKPVMEGKGLLFKIYAGIDVFDIEVDEKDPEKFIAAVKAIAPTFGGINLEDIKAPECFEIERRLKEELDIPVMHDDQHGTAIISSAGLVNALQVAGKKIEDVKIVVNGAGASAVSCTKLYVSLGARLENIVMLDSKGVISKTRTDLNEQKRYFATDRTDIHTLEEAIKGADVFLGLSKGNVLSQDMVRSMAPMPIVFALANPTPEIILRRCNERPPRRTDGNRTFRLSEPDQQRNRLPVHLPRRTRYTGQSDQRRNENRSSTRYRQPGKTACTRCSKRSISRQQPLFRSGILHPETGRPAPHHRSFLCRSQSSHGKRSGTHGNQRLGRLLRSPARTDGIRIQTDPPAL